MNHNAYIDKLAKVYSNFNTKPYIKLGYRKDEVLQLKEAFDLFDLQHNLFLNINYLKRQLTQMGIESKNDILDKWLSENVEGIDFQVFVELMGAKATCKTREEVKKLFFVFIGEEDENKKLTIDSFKKVANDLELNLGSNEIEDMISAVQPKERGIISFDEFYNVMMKIY